MQLTDRENINIMSIVILMMKAGKRKSVCWFSARIKGFLSLAPQLRIQQGDGPIFLLFKSEAPKSQNYKSIGFFEGGEHI